MPENGFPNTPAERDSWILARRGARRIVDPWRPNAVLRELEATGQGGVADVWTVFLANRECPWRCTMCDLWRDTLQSTVPSGAITAQIDVAYNQLLRLPLPPGPEPRQRWVKLYNSGSFFDSNAIPPDEYRSIAERLRGINRLIVECHPRLVGERVEEFQSALRDVFRGTPPSFEVALGLETAHRETLEKLNKRMTFEDFAAAASRLRSRGVDVRVFLLVGLPFLSRSASQEWVRRSIRKAFESGASVVSLIPVRTGNGALEALAAQGLFAEPLLEDLESSLEFGLSLGLGRVLADLWNLERFASCPACLASRRERLHGMNLSQEVPPPIACPHCRGSVRLA
jgi:hypothetical protein